MKKTCNSCIFYDGRLRVCDSEPGINAHEKDDPSCGKWRLDGERLMEAANNSLRKAREKHPVFLYAWPEAEDAEVYEASAKMWKKVIVHKEFDQLRSVIYSEVNEFLVEVARGDFNAALSEAGDVVAILYRALNNEGKQEESK